METIDAENCTDSANEQQNEIDRLKRLKPVPKTARLRIRDRFSFLWRRCDGSSIPHNAVPGGQEDGLATYVGRAEHKRHEIPGKVVSSQGCYVSFAGCEHCYNKFDVLANDGNLLKWVPSCGGAVPAKAIVGGRTLSGEKLYIGRTDHDGLLILGRIQPSHGCLYIPYGGAEHRYTVYEVLVTESVFPIG